MLDLQLLKERRGSQFKNPLYEPTTEENKNKLDFEKEKAHICFINSILTLTLLKGNQNENN